MSGEMRFLIVKCSWNKCVSTKNFCSYLKAWIEMIRNFLLRSRWKGSPFVLREIWREHLWLPSRVDTLMVAPWRAGAAKEREREIYLCERISSRCDLVSTGQWITLHHPSLPAVSDNRTWWLVGVWSLTEAGEGEGTPQKSSLFLRLTMQLILCLHAWRPNPDESGSWW